MLFRAAAAEGAQDKTRGDGCVVAQTWLREVFRQLAYGACNQILFGWLASAD